MTQPAPVSVRVTPADLRWATRRNIPPKSRPEARTFDKYARLEDILAMRGSWRWQWDSVTVPAHMTREEAHFWLMAIMQSVILPRTDRMTVVKSLEQMDFDGDVSIMEVHSVLCMRPCYVPFEQLVTVMVNLFSVEDIVWAITQPVIRVRQHATRFIQAFRACVLPHLTDEGRQAYRDVIRPCMDDIDTMHVAGSRVSQSADDIPHPMLYLAACLGGFSAEIEALVENIPDDYFTDHPDESATQIEIFFGIEDPAKVIQHTRRTGIS